MNKLSLKRLNIYQITVVLSSVSMMFGVAREFLIVGLLGFSAENDQLQVYLSIFYSIGLSIDAMRLSCINLYHVLSLTRILLISLVVALPFSIAVGMLMNYCAGGLDPTILCIAILGSCVNLIVAVLIAYKQRNGSFLISQVINVIPNFVLIPGIAFIYFLVEKNVIFYLVALCCLVPVVQLAMFVFVPTKFDPQVKRNGISFSAAMMVFIRHGTAVIGEQFFQIFTRAAFFNLGAGYLSLLSMSLRIYSAARFILVDSYIGTKLAKWKGEAQNSEDFLHGLMNSKWLGAAVLLVSTAVLYPFENNLVYFSVQVICLLLCSFYFSTLVRIAYFKINCNEHDSNLVLKFGKYELIFAFITYLLVDHLAWPVMTFLWTWYIAKSFTQMLFLRQKLYQLSVV